MHPLTTWALQGADRRERDEDDRLIARQAGRGRPRRPSTPSERVSSGFAAARVERPAPCCPERVVLT